MVTNNNNKRKRKSYSLEKKKKIINFTIKNSRLSQRDLSVHFKIPLGVINKILKEKESLLSLDEKLCNKKKVRPATLFPEVEKYIYEWFSIKCVQL